MYMNNKSFLGAGDVGLEVPHMNVNRNQLPKKTIILGVIVAGWGSIPTAHKLAPPQKKLQKKILPPRPWFQKMWVPSVTAVKSASSWSFTARFSTTGTCLG